ncbi:MAG: alginate export family protein, partial [Candidatus Hydrogenedentes bacterium]|nr:alginate export family protein [Candidatus Hydrogenedentota bacterium]
AGGPREVRRPEFFVPRRPIGPFGLESRFDWDSKETDLQIIEQKTKIGVLADFTDHVSAYVELESFDLWGEDFRSDYVTGIDSRAATQNDVEVLQSWIDVGDILGQPLTLRIGRQPLKFGKAWLVSDSIASTLNISFDGVRLTYDVEDFVVDAWYTKLVESGIAEQDGDVDFSGVYATYRGLEHLKASLYWMWIRDARSLNDTNFVAPIERLEDLFNLDDYDVTNLYTVGTRLWGKYADFDYDLELAYQFGEADAVGFGFKPVSQIYGDDGAEYDNWGSDLELGYSFPDVPWAPRLFLGGAYFTGEDNRDLSFGEYINPFYRPEASVSFNRLFSYSVYSWLLDTGQEMSNFHQIRAGAEAHPTDKLTVHFNAAYFGANEVFDNPRMVTVGRFRIPLAPALSFWTEESDDYLGTRLYLWLRYNYSEDLFFRVGWERLFVGDGLVDGSFTGRNGLEFNAGTGKEDADYFFFECGLTFGSPDLRYN